MFHQKYAGSSNLAQPDDLNISKISGPVPGALDPTQPERLYRHPGSNLFFAAFDPHTASSAQGIPDFRKLSLNEELYRPKRVVIETTPSGESFWRFVPSARREGGVLNEGIWPRVVEICGRLYECSQDQWDIYKLDPFYDCYIRSYPNLTVISPRSEARKSPPATKVGHKRHSPLPSPEGPTGAENSRKKVQHEPETSSDEGEEGEVEGMVVDDMPFFSGARPHNQAKVRKEELMKGRRERREKAARRTEELTKKDEVFLHNQERSKDVSESEVAGKRKINSLLDSLKFNGHPDFDDTHLTEDELSRNNINYIPSKRGKRTRTVSPTSAKRDLDARRLSREKRKQVRREEEVEARRQARHSQFLHEVYTEVPDPHTPDHETNPDDDLQRALDIDGDKVNSGEEAVRNAAIAASRRKLAELEADKPLWEAAAAKRKEEEREEELRCLRVQAEKRAAAAQADRERREREEAEKVAQEEAEKMARARHEKERRRRQSWLYGKWSHQRAMEKYLDLSKMFDETKFSVQNPLTVDVVPWPVLQSPSTFSVEDVTWQAVEEFFDVFRSKMRTQDFKILVEQSHRRFHPDRWRSRSLLTNVVDEVERGCMEVAANTVAQALTPMWQHVRAVGRR